MVTVLFSWGKEYGKEMTVTQTQTCKSRSNRYSKFYFLKHVLFVFILSYHHCYFQDTNHEGQTDTVNYIHVCLYYGIFGFKYINTIMAGNVQTCLIHRSEGVLIF